MASQVLDDPAGSAAFPADDVARSTTSSDAEAQKKQHEAKRKEWIENQKQVKLGMLVVQLGVAPVEEVFPNGITSQPVLAPLPKPNPPPEGPWATRLKKAMLSLFVGGKKEVPAAAIAKAKKVHQPPAASAASLPPPAAANHASSSPSQEHAVSSDHGPTPSLENLNTVERHPKVAQMKEKLEYNEQMMHNVLQEIENQRARYLVASKSTVCKKQLDEVTKCYSKANELEKKAYAAVAKDAAKKEKDQTGGAKVALNQEKYETLILGSATLQCSGVVEQLAKCAHATATRHAALNLSESGM